MWLSRSRKRLWSGALGESGRATACEQTCHLRSPLTPPLLNTQPGRPAWRVAKDAERGGMATPRTISLDAMGGDQGPAMVVPGAALALERHPDVSFLLYGNEERIRPYLLAYPALAERAKVI